jgi:hypothetical protein
VRVHRDEEVSTAKHRVVGKTTWSRTSGVSVLSSEKRKRLLLFVLSWHYFVKKMVEESDVDHCCILRKITRTFELSRGDKETHGRCQL